MGQVISLSKKQKDKPPFTPECEVLYEGGPNPEQLTGLCPKNPGHHNFVPVKLFDIRKHLPPEYHTDSVRQHIQAQCDLTTKITTSYTSHNRPDAYPNTTAPYPYAELKGSSTAQRVGTGFVVGRPSLERNGSCPCPECVSGSGNPKIGFLWVMVMTSLHVVFDDSEAACTTCEMFYDSPDRRGVMTLYGVGTSNHSNRYKTQQQQQANTSNGESFDNGSRNHRNHYNTQQQQQQRGIFANSEFLDLELKERCHSDVAFVPCVTHELELLERLPPSYTVTPPCAPLPLIVSHPHGLSKHITVGTFCHLITPIPPTIPIGVGAPPTPITFPKGVISKCRIAITAPIETRKSLRRFLKHHHQPCIPYVEYEIKERVTIILPLDATFLCQGFIPKLKWAKFPKETQFIITSGTGDGSDTIILLPGVEFCLTEAVKMFYPDGNVPYYMMYDADTCPGSSGATIVDDCFYGQDTLRYLNSPHSGAVVKKTSLSRSGGGVFRQEL